MKKEERILYNYIKKNYVRKYITLIEPLSRKRKDVIGHTFTPDAILILLKFIPKDILKLALKTFKDENKNNRKVTFKEI